MDDKNRNLKIKNIFIEFRGILKLSGLLLIYSSLDAFGIFPERFPVLAISSSDIIIGTLTLIGLVIALEGLNTWKKQMAGKYNFDLACEGVRLLREIHKSFLQIGDMWIFDLDDENLINYDDQTVRFKVKRKYWDNLENIKDLIRKIETLQPELVIAWDNSPIGELDDFIQLINAYFLMCQSFLGFFHVEQDDQVFTFDLKNNGTTKIKSFKQICSDFLFYTEARKAIYSGEFENVKDLIQGAYEPIFSFLKGIIADYQSNT